MRTQADEKMKLAERMIVENRRKTAKTIHAERSLSKTTNDKLKYLATTALSMERSDNHADKVKTHLLIDNLKGSHLTQVDNLKLKNDLMIDNLKGSHLTQVDNLKLKNDLMIDNLKGSHLTQVTKMKSKHQDVHRKSVAQLRDVKESLKESYSAKHQDANRKSVEVLRDLRKSHAAESKELKTNHANERRVIHDGHFKKVVTMKSDQRQLKRKHSALVLDKNCTITQVKRDHKNDISGLTLDVSQLRKVSQVATKECAIANSLAAKRHLNIVKSKESVSALRDSLEEQRVINRELCVINGVLNKDIANQKKKHEQQLGQNQIMILDKESEIGYLEDECLQLVEEIEVR